MRLRSGLCELLACFYLRQFPAREETSDIVPPTRPPCNCSFAGVGVLPEQAIRSRGRGWRLAALEADRNAKQPFSFGRLGGKLLFPRREPNIRGVGDPMIPGSRIQI